jgi:hypothetical protein
MARNKNHRKQSSKDVPFWESGVNPITMKKEESYAVVKIENYDVTSKTRV